MRKIKIELYHLLMILVQYLIHFFPQQTQRYNYFTLFQAENAAMLLIPLSHQRLQRLLEKQKEEG